MNIAQSYDYRGRPRRLVSQSQSVAADHGRCSDIGSQLIPCLPHRTALKDVNLCIDERWLLDLSAQQQSGLWEALEIEAVPPSQRNHVIKLLRGYGTRILYTLYSNTGPNTPIASNK